MEFVEHMIDMLEKNGTWIAIVPMSCALTSNKQNNEVILLKENVIDTFFTMKLKVEDKKLSIDINGQKTINKNIGFWDYKNYFKLGAFPQAKIGDFTVSVKNLSVYLRGKKCLIKYIILQ